MRNCASHASQLHSVLGADGIVALKQTVIDLNTG